ncbi:FAD-dependent oxidoreductase [Streptomyces sp. N2-109]|uniref:FAD-dependent oxidoreductase n=1 Tax=Streptomyces gossypii TaxID=2883101 RepID=A0ABT2JZM7_9ACTN|nr:FAD-dependent oxidoreductase [Streptomyces gossypii]MCT2593362.1 FAD-dependent oxidoreductase [Streptomyces gossypii]
MTDSPEGAPHRAPERAVIVGAGMAGVQTAVQLREQGWAGTITLIGAESHRPYDRPPLSKAVLLGKAEGSEFDTDYDDLGIGLELGREITGLRPAAHLLDTSGGEAVPYDRLVLATGAAPAPPPGATSPSAVHLLRTLDDAARLRPVLLRRGSVVVVGAGWIGAEFATAAREAGCEVTVVEAADRPLAGALPAEVTGYMSGWYEESGVRLRTGAPVAAVTPDGVLLAGGEQLSGDAVVVGIGARPATGWLAGSGVELCPDGSVRADAELRTSVPDVYAVGDCASFPSARYGRRLLVHHWDNALQSARVAAANLVAEGHAGQTAKTYDPVPYFWSEQFGRFVQYAGQHSEGDQLVRRGDPSGAAWSVCWLRDGVLTALLAVGRPRDLAQGRKLVQQGTQLDPVLVADPALALKKALR